MHFFGLAWLGYANAGNAFPWHKMFGPFDISMYIYTVLIVIITHFATCRRYYYARPRYKFILALLVTLMFFILFRYVLEEMLYPALIGEGNYNPQTSFRFYVVDNIYFGLLKMFFGVAIFFVDEAVRQHKQKAALLQQNKQAELNFLQLQMNPHFLFNSLNNIYSLAQSQHPQTAAAILKLSDMMRYTTYGINTANTFADELHYTQNLTALHQLRCAYPLQVINNISPEVLSLTSMPFLLIPLVENALKHGDLSDAAMPLTITATKNNNNFELTVSNKKSQQKNTAGIGLKNLERRLELTYRPGTYSYTAMNEEQRFTINIKICLP
jgi:sensor histidine kinase YesM